MSHIPLVICDDLSAGVMGLNVTCMDPCLCPCTLTQGYKQYKGFIITQAPMKITCRDFWKMIHERECGVVVMLSDLVENGRVRYSTAD